MTPHDAAKILGLSGQITLTLVKKAFRRAAMTYHPDRNPAGAEMMKVINQAFEVLKGFNGVIEEQKAGEQDYPEALNDALNAIIHCEGLEIEICGAWVWVGGNSFKHKAVLKKAGFKFASKKKRWYFRPDDWQSKGRGTFSMDEIRDTYGSAKPARPSRQVITNGNG